MKTFLILLNFLFASCVYSQDFTIDIMGKSNGEWAVKSQKNKQVLMDHLEVYAIKLTNQFKGNVDVNVQIDGKNIGTFRVKPKSQRVLERGTMNSGRFTFIKKDTKEFKDAQLDKNNKNLGFVKATFYPEKLKLKEQFRIKIERIEKTGTGLSGQSDQKFQPAEKIKRNNRQKTEISLQLIEK